MITSTANQQIKNIMRLRKQSKERREQGVFLAEGVRMLEEIPPDWLDSIYVSESFLAKFSAKNERLEQGNLKKLNRLSAQGIKCETVSDAVFKRISDTQTPQGILGVVRRPSYELSDLIQKERTHLLILEGIQDPGNLGTMLRTAEGAGVTGVILNPGCADLFAPKTVRSTMGSICRVPFYSTKDLPGTIRALKKRQVRVYAAHLCGQKNYDEFDYRGATAFLIGSEGNGLSDEAAQQADDYLCIPMGGKLESLNAAMAAGILMYEAARQRRKQ